MKSDTKFCHAVESGLCGGIDIARQADMVFAPNRKIQSGFFSNLPNSKLNSLAN